MTIQSLARWAFVNVAGRLPDYGLAFSKVAYWIRFSKWYMAKGARISKFDARKGRRQARGDVERVVAKEGLDHEGFAVYAVEALDECS